VEFRGNGATGLEAIAEAALAYIATLDEAEEEGR